MKLKPMMLGAALLAPLVLAAEIPAGYYDRCEGLCGAELLEALNATISDHTNVGYSNLYALFRTTDVRPDDGTIWDIYSTKHWSPGSTCGNYSGIGDCYNREHSFPKSWFGGEVNPMYADAYHLYPTDGKVNGYRGNLPYGECASGTTWRAGDILALGRSGASTTPGYSGTVFEPDDMYKGDLARSYFYMVTCYNHLVDDWDSPMLDGTSYPAFSSWALDMLMRWHRQDQVSDKETARNEAVSAAQHNRNPYIDHPELADHIWGSKSAEPWYADGDGAAVTSPVDGLELDLGLTAVGRPVTMYVGVAGHGLTDDLTVTVEGGMFTVSPTSLAAAEVNARTAGLDITYNPVAADSHQATLRIASGQASSTVRLSGRAQTGIPVYDATDVYESGFTVRWVAVDSAGTPYTVTVNRAGRGVVDGFPCQADAADCRLSVGGLEGSTKYEYTVSSATATSRTVSVTTAAPAPVITLSSEEHEALTAREGEPSGAVEIGVEVQNIDSNIAITVDAPFEVCTDRKSWATQLAISSDDTRFYLRVGATSPGTYTTAVIATAGDYQTDDFTVTATVTPANFTETFENPTTLSGYAEGLYNGTAGTWHVKRGNIWDDDNKYNGTRSMRFNTDSHLELAADKQGGIGRIAFDVRRWAAKDATLTLAVETSADQGATWTEAGRISLDKSVDGFVSRTVEANVQGPTRVRFVQIAGARYNLDNIVLGDYGASLSQPVLRGWDAWSADGRLMVDTGAEQRQVAVYGVDGITWHDAVLAPGTTSLDLPAGVYVVVSGDTSLRIAVKRN